MAETPKSATEQAAENAKAPQEQTESRDLGREQAEAARIKRQNAKEARERALSELEDLIQTNSSLPDGSEMEPMGVDEIIKHAAKAYREYSHFSSVFVELRVNNFSEENEHFIITRERFESLQHSLQVYAAAFVAAKGVDPTNERAKDRTLKEFNFRVVETAFPNNDIDWTPGEDPHLYIPSAGAFHDDVDPKLTANEAIGNQDINSGKSKNGGAPSNGGAPNTKSESSSDDNGSEALSETRSDKWTGAEVAANLLDRGLMPSDLVASHDPAKQARAIDVAFPPEEALSLKNALQETGPAQEAALKTLDAMAKRLQPAFEQLRATQVALEQFREDTIKDRAFSKLGALAGDLAKNPAAIVGGLAAFYALYKLYQSTTKDTQELIKTATFGAAGLIGTGIFADTAMKSLTGKGLSDRLGIKNKPLDPACLKQVKDSAIEQGMDPSLVEEMIALTQVKVGFAVPLFEKVLRNSSTKRELDPRDFSAVVESTALTQRLSGKDLYAFMAYLSDLAADRELKEKNLSAPASETEDAKLLRGASYLKKNYKDFDIGTLVIEFRGFQDLANEDRKGSLAGAPAGGPQSAPEFKREALVEDSIPALLAPLVSSGKGVLLREYIQTVPSQPNVVVIAGAPYTFVVTGSGNDRSFTFRYAYADKQPAPEERKMFTISLNDDVNLIPAILAEAPLLTMEQIQKQFGDSNANSEYALWKAKNPALVYRDNFWEATPGFDLPKHPGLRRDESEKANLFFGVAPEGLFVNSGVPGDNTRYTSIKTALEANDRYRAELQVKKDFGYLLAGVPFKVVKFEDDTENNKTTVHVEYGKGHNATLVYKNNACVLAESNIVQDDELQAAYFREAQQFAADLFNTPEAKRELERIARELVPQPATWTGSAVAFYSRIADQITNFFKDGSQGELDDEIFRTVSRARNAIIAKHASLRFGAGAWTSPLMTEANFRANERECAQKGLHVLEAYVRTSKGMTLSEDQNTAIDYFGDAVKVAEPELTAEAYQKMFNEARARLDSVIDGLRQSPFYNRNGLEDHVINDMKAKYAQALTTQLGAGARTRNSMIEVTKKLDRQALLEVSEKTTASAEELVQEYCQDRLRTLNRDQTAVWTTALETVVDYLLANGGWNLMRGSDSLDDVEPFNQVVDKFIAAVRTPVPQVGSYMATSEETMAYARYFLNTLHQSIPAGSNSATELTTWGKLYEATWDPFGSDTFGSGITAFQPKSFDEWNQIPLNYANNPDNNPTETAIQQNVQAFSEYYYNLNNINTHDEYDRFVIGRFENILREAMVPGPNATSIPNISQFPDLLNRYKLFVAAERETIYQTNRVEVDQGIFRLIKNAMNTTTFSSYFSADNLQGYISHLELAAKEVASQHYYPWGAITSIITPTWLTN